MESKDKTTDKPCLICGAKASGFNFAALSCIPCKSFFQRNAFKQHLFCRQQECCSIEVSTRNSCKRCRLSKCVQMGMHKELVKYHKTKSISKHRGVRHAEVDVLEQQPENSNQSNQIELARNVNFTTSLLSNVALNNLNHGQYDRYFLGQIQSGISLFADERTAEHSNNTLTHQIETLNQSWFYIRTFTNFCKQFDAFKHLKETDQLSLLKSATHFMMGVWFTFLYQPEWNCVRLFEDETFNRTVTFKFKIAFRGMKWRQSFYHKAATYKRLMDNDVNIRNLLMAIVLFKDHESTESPECPEYIRYHCSVYSRYLRLYLQSKYKNEYKSDEQYCLLMEQIEGSKQTRQAVRQLYVKVGVEHISHTLKEVYDLVKN